MAPIPPFQGFTNQQVQQLMTMMAMTFANYAQVQPAQGAGQSHKVHLSKPRDYDGGADYQDFRRECEDYIAVAGAGLATDADKI